MLCERADMLRHKVHEQDRASFLKSSKITDFVLTNRIYDAYSLA